MNLSVFRRPSRYINQEINSVHKTSSVRIALCFPDIYEIGMSHLGLRILYSIINNLPYASAERIFAPWIDMEDHLRKERIPLCSLESATPLRDFDLAGFSLQYELSYTTVLNMLSLGGVPIRASMRDDKDPIVIGGGPCTLNPTPLFPFFDAFLLGDGEDAITEIVDLIHSHKKEGDNRRESLLKALSQVEGVMTPGAPERTVKRRVITDLNAAPYPCFPVVPFTQIVHDRISIEISRGCTRGCRFCQAGMIYRPLREREPEKILALAEKMLEHSGYDEVSFTSLSAGDYSQLLNLVKMFHRRFSERTVSLSLPSIRVDAISDDLMREMRRVRKTGFTIAPEAATSRLRLVINKGLDEDAYERALHSIFKNGWLNLKLYFMMGLPTERDEDVEAIPQMALRALKIAKKYTRKFVNINVSVSTFVPKPHTPFQWYGQIPFDEVKRKTEFLKRSLSKRGLKFKGHDERMRVLEAALARGNSGLAPLIEHAWSAGARLDAWTELFDYRAWMDAMEKTGVDIDQMAQRHFASHDTFPWDRIDTGVGRDFLWREYGKALEEAKTVDCQVHCQACGLTCGSGQYLAAESVELSSQGKFALQAHQKRFSPVRVRMTYEKKDNLRYLSHLELMMTIERGVRRAGVTLEYSKGFHPSPQISFGPPLNVGVSGAKEYLDMEVVPPFDISLYGDLINAKMPEGIRVTGLSFIPRDLPALSQFISAYKYEISLKRRISSEDVEERLMHEDTRWVSPLIVDYTIADRVFTVLLQDTPEQKVKLSETVKTLLGESMESLRINRIGLYGWENGWIEPDDIENLRRWNKKKACLTR